MIRLIIFVVLLFLIWVLFVSDFKRKVKIIISVAAVVLCALGVWLDGYGEKPKTGVVALDQIVVCGVNAQHSYRTNYDVTLCLKNVASEGTVRRVTFAVSVQRCAQASDCTEVDRVTRDMPIELIAGQSLSITENLSFKQVSRTDQNLIWQAEILQIKATR